MAHYTFYYHIKRIGQSDGYDDLRARIREIYDQHKGRYVYRRITIQLRDEGVIVNHKRMNQRYRSYKGNVGKIAPNVINRDFSADAPDQKWTTDVTQVKISLSCYICRTGNRSMSLRKNSKPTSNTTTTTE